MAGRPDDFDRRGVKPPPVITHAPDGLEENYDEEFQRRRLRTLVVSLAAIGVGTAVALFALAETVRRERDCGPPDDAHADRQPCASASGSSGGAHGGGFSSTSSGSGAHGVSFGGFGAAGAGHGGGGE